MDTEIIVLLLSEIIYKKGFYQILKFCWSCRTSPPGILKKMYGCRTSPPGILKKMYGCRTSPLGILKKMYGCCTSPPGILKKMYGCRTSLPTIFIKIITIRQIPPLERGLGGVLLQYKDGIIIYQNPIIGLCIIKI